MSMPASMIKISSSSFSYQWTLVHRFVFLPLQGAIKLDLICTLEEWTRCDDDFDIVGICCHIDEDHPVEAKNGLSKKRKSRVSGDMQNGEVIWQIIRHNHCSFMAKIETGIFCRNPYNVTGICNRRYCPLANSRYATIRDHDGVFYLYMKTIERAHNPNQLWERVKLSTNYDEARENIGKHLMYWPEELIHKVKQRLTKMYQMQIRTRKLALKTREKIMTTPRKEIKREARREEKAEKAAVLDKSIEKELLERLKKGVYRDIYNYPLKEYNKVLDMETLEAASEDEEEEHEIEYVEGYEELEEEDDIEDFGGFALNESYEDDKSVDDDEDMVAIDGKRSTKASALALRKLEKGEPGTITKKRTRVLVEVEHDDTDERQKTFH